MILPKIENTNYYKNVIAEKENIFISPTAYTLTDMTYVSGTLADLKFIKSTYLIIQEDNTTNGNAVFTFSNVVNFSSLLFTGSYYPNSTSHYYQIAIYDVVTSAWVNIGMLTAQVPIQSFNIRFSNDKDYISLTGEVKIRFLHSMTGTTSHNLNLDQLVLLVEHNISQRVV